MTLFEAFFLGLIQGITEFFPVSSSGHLALVQYFWLPGSPKDYLLFDLVCHLGTLGALFVLLFPVIRAANRGLFLRVCLAVLPLFPLLLILGPIKRMFDHPEFLGPCFLFSAFLLFISYYYRLPTGGRSKFDPLTIGLFQAVAILPGISRSGSTISGAKLLGWEHAEAVRFSFLLAIPTILGGVVVEGWQLWKTGPSSLSFIDPATFFIGFCTSFLMGLVSLWACMRLITSYRWNYFAWYCLVLGLFCIVYFSWGVDYGA